MLANCNEIGSINTMPEIAGLLVFMRGHVGVYIGNGNVIEAKGHKYGVVQTKLKDRPWTEYGKLKWINYEEETMEELSIAEKLEKIKEYYGFDDNTANYFAYYRYNIALIDKLYNKIK